MRRFIKSTIGKLIGNIAAVSLFIPYATTFVASSAKAQMVEAPAWAVLDFVNKSGKGPDTLGASAADSVRGELEKTGKYDMLTREAITRAYASLNILPPVVSPTSLLRLGEELKAQTIITGEIVNWRIVKDGVGRRADIIIQVSVFDCVSGLTVNGVGLSGSSAIRPADTADDIMISDALASATSAAIRKISERELPHATVLNTYQMKGFINKGSNYGFKPGQELVIFRGRQQVGAGVVTDVDPESSEVKYTKVFRGIQPGDRVRVIFKPDVSIGQWGKDNEAIGKHVVKPGLPSGLMTLVTVLGLITLVVATGGGGNPAVSSFKAEATAEPVAGGLAAIRLSWSPDMFQKGFDRRKLWQIYRNGEATPAVTAPGSQTSVLDTSALRTVNYYADIATGGTTCLDQPELVTLEDVAGVVSGVPYSYKINLFYIVLGIEMPNVDPGQEECWFMSNLTASKGIATPYNLPALTSPAPSEVISGPVTFTFGAVGSLLAPGVTTEYIVQVSPTSTFAKKTIVSKFTRSETAGTLSAGPIELSGLYPTSTELYWRVGVRNIFDKPGPRPDALTKERYIFSVPRRLARS